MTRVIASRFGTIPQMKRNFETELHLFRSLGNFGFRDDRRRVVDSYFRTRDERVLTRQPLYPFLIRTPLRVG